MNHYELLFVNIKRYRKNQQFCDITFDVMGTKFPLHRLVISSASNYFEAMFTKGFVKPDQKEVVMKGVTPSAFDVCMEFIYDGTINITKDGLDDLFHAACLFQLEKLRAKCIDHIRNIIGVDNCVKFYQLSLREECQEIEDDASNVMLKNAEKILTDDSIISTVNEESLSMMLKSDELNISDESVAFQALVKWTDMDKERNEWFCGLMQQIRLPLINKVFFTSVVYEHEHIQKKCAECKSYLQQTTMHFVDGKDHGLKQYQLKARNRMSTDADNSQPGATDNWEDASKSLMCDVAANTDVTDNDDIEIVVTYFNCKSFKLFDVANDTFTDDVKLDPIPVDTTYRALIHHNDKIYVMGGNNGRRSFYCDYRRNKTWHELPLMPSDHNMSGYYESSVVCYNDKILVVGGFIHGKATNLVPCFCTQTNTWSKFPSLNEERCAVETVMTDEHVYVIGGLGSLGQCLSSVEMFDSNKWNRVPSLNTARCYHAAVYHNQKIFVAGGYGDDYLTSVETFVEGDSSWTNIASLNYGRSSASMFTHHGKLYVFGGDRNKSNLYEVWCETSNTWKLSEVGYYSLKGCKVLLCNNGIKRR